MRAPLQDPVALGMTAYIRATFRLRAFGAEHLQIGPGQIFAPSHRSGQRPTPADQVLYPTWSKAVGAGAPWPTFAAMIELFLPGLLRRLPGGPGRERTLDEALVRARRRGPTDPLIQRWRASSRALGANNSPLVRVPAREWRETRAMHG